MPAYGDFYGTTVNLAARAVKVAEPGSVLVNRTIAEAIEEVATRMSTRAAGRHDQRGFPTTTELFVPRRN